MSLKAEIIDELHRPARKRYRRRHIVMIGIDNHWQADLVDVSSIAGFNKKHNFILTVIDTFSKYAFARGIKNKRGEEVAKAMESIFDESNRVCQILESDRGKEFYNKHFQNLLRAKNVKHFSTYSDMKCSIVERFNRSLKEIMWKSFSLNSSYNWIDNLQKYVEFYNKRIHRTIKMAPCDVREEHSWKLLKTAYDYSKEKRKPVKFAVGDHVRISKYKHVFEKGYTPNWSTEIFTIADVNTDSNPETYHLTDIHNERILGGFYRENLQKVKNWNGYLIEKILKRKPGKIYVKFLGFSSKHNGWIDANTDQ